MDYKKIEKDNYNIHIIDSDRFKNTVVQVVFTKEFNKDDIILDKLLKTNMVYSTKKYNTRIKTVKKTEDLYGADIVSSNSILGNFQIIEFNLEFLNPKYTSEDMYKESMDFFMEVLFNPNVKNGEFNREYFDLILNEAIIDVENINVNPNLYSSVEYSKLMYKGTPSEYCVYSSVDEIKKVTPSKLYKHYLKLFSGHYKIDVLLHGENSEKLVPFIEKKFKDIKQNKKKLDIFVKVKDGAKLKEKEDVMPFSQSKIYLGYRINNYNDTKDYYTLRVLNIMLGTMNNSILFDTVREKNGLCYNISSYISRYNTSLNIYSGINKNNKDKAITLIKECVSSLKSKVLVDNMIDTARHNIETNLNGYYDDLIGQINNIYMREFINNDADIEVYRSKLLSVSSEDIVELAKRLNLTTIYFMKGDLE